MCVLEFANSNILTIFHFRKFLWLKENMKLQKCYMGCTFLDRKTNQNLVNKCDDLIFSKDFAWNSAGRASSISTAKAFITWDSGFKNTDARSDLAVLSSVLLSFVPFCLEPDWRCIAFPNSKCTRTLLNLQLVGKKKKKFVWLGKKSNECVIG